MIRKRLVFLFTMQIAIVLLVSGFYLRYHLKNVLEKELAAKLEAVAASVSGQIDASLVVLLGPGDENTRIYRNLKQRLERILEKTDMARILLITPSGGIWVDTQMQQPVGTLYSQYSINLAEISQAVNGQMSSSVLFKGYDNQLYKSAFAPITLEDKIVGAVAVEGSAQSLKAVKNIQNDLIRIGIVSLIFSVFLALIFSKKITESISNLQKSAKRIGQGDLETKIEVKGKDEISYLAKAMEDMRRAIVQRDEQQMAMMAGVAHEIRNPLGGIELFAGLLYDEFKNQPVQNHAEKILKETRNLKQLVQNFLDFARPIKPNRRICNVFNCWREAKELLGPEFEKKQVRIVEEGDAQVFVDPQHLKQVFMNLALNAAQAVKKKGVIKIKISDNSDNVQICFSDNGPGIAEQDVERVFEPFFSNKEKGLGLGLPMVKSLITQNSGNIELVFNESNGAVFLITLPKINGVSNL